MIAVDSICSDGPDHHFDLSVAARIDLLQQLSNSNCINSFESLVTPDFINNYLLMSYECCGTAIKLIAEEIHNPSFDEEGIWRVVDASLLTCRAIFLSYEELGCFSRGLDHVGVEKSLSLTLPLLIEVTALLAQFPNAMK
jgi:hypothetical protein